MAPSALERDALTRKRRGAASFETALLIEVAGTTFEAAKALLWRLTDAIPIDGADDWELAPRWSALQAGAAALLRGPASPDLVAIGP